MDNLTILMQFFYQFACSKPAVHHPAPPVHHNAPTAHNNKPVAHNNDSKTWRNNGHSNRGHFGGRR